MARTEVEIKLEQNPLNNHRFQYVIKDNGQSITYVDSDNETSSKMEKKFIKKDNTPMGHFSSSDKNFIIDTFNENAGFNGEVTDLVFIPRDVGEEVHIFTADNGYITADTIEYTADEYIVEGDNQNFPISSTGHPYLIGVIGDFTKYTYEDNTEVNVNKFALINFDKMFMANEIEFYFTQNYLFDTSAKLNSIDYNSIRGEIAIGGLFETVTTQNNISLVASNIMFFNPGSQEVVSAKTENVSNNGGFNGEVLCVGYGRGNNLIVSGSFTEYMYRNKGYIMTVNTTGGLDVGFSNNSNVNGTVKRFHVTRNGLIYIVGEFTEVNNRDKNNIAVLDTFGNSNNNFNFDTTGFDVSPNDVTTYTYTVGNNSSTYVFVGGDFTEYNGNPVGNIIKMDTNGMVLSLFNTSHSNIKVNRLSILDITTKLTLQTGVESLLPVSTTNNSPFNLYVSGGYSSSNDIGALVINHLSGMVEEEIFYNDEVNVILLPTNYQLIQAFRDPKAGKVIYGGKFTTFDNTTKVLGKNEVEVGIDKQETLDNLMTEILINNNNNNSVYEEIDSDTIKHSYLYFSNNIVSVDSIIEEPNYIKITVTQYGDDGEVISPILNIRKIKPVLLRSDYVVKGENGNFTSTNYQFSSYKEDFNNADNSLQEIKINKPKLTAEQENTWVNISPLVNSRVLETHKAIDHYVNITGRVDSTKQGLYGLIIKENLQGDSTISEKAEVVYVLKGFRDKNSYPTTVPQILLNGRYREVTEEGRVLIPYNAAYTSTVVIRRPNGSAIEIIDLDQEDGYNSKPWTLDGYLMYFNFEASRYSGEKFTLDFIGHSTSTITIRKRRDNCLTDTSTVIFVNRWGILEETQMIGVESKSLRIEGKDYAKSIRDINGNLINNLHSQTSYKKNAEESYVHSTGTVGEEMNKVYEDLVLSEDIWLVKDSVLTPVILDETNFGHKTILKDKTIDYQFTFKEANNKIKNNI